MRNLIFHRGDMIHCQKGFESLNDDSFKTEFNKNLLELIETIPCTVVAATLDKKAIKDKFLNLKPAYSYILEFILQRYIMFLNEHNAKGDILIESRGRNEDKDLKKIFNKYYSNGIKYFELKEIKNRLTSNEIKIKDKKEDISGLELADIFANPMRNFTLELYGKSNITNKDDFTANLLSVLKPKVKNKNGEYKGIGCVLKD